jgi:hypothetical protein
MTRKLPGAVALCCLIPCLVGAGPTPNLVASTITPANKFIIYIMSNS